MSNFSFSQNVFYPFGELLIFIKFKIVGCKVLSLEGSKICHLGKGYDKFWFMSSSADRQGRNRLVLLREWLVCLIRPSAEGSVENIHERMTDKSNGHLRLFVSSKLFSISKELHNINIWLKPLTLFSDFWAACGTIIADSKSVVRTDPLLPSVNTVERFFRAVLLVKKLRTC